MKIKFISILSITALLSSCSGWIDSSLNTDPNNPADVSMSSIVAPIEANLAYVVGGDLARTTCGWMQQIAGLQSQAGDNDVYNISESDVNNSWSYNLYNPGMSNTKILMEKAVSQNSPHYGGVAKILMAYQLGVTTDLWGDIPYSDALALTSTNGKTKSKYDTQQTIYTTIFSLLNSAITDLNATESTFEPGAEDLIYGGDLSAWEKTAYALIARYKLHLVKSGNATYADVLTALANAYTSNDGDFKVVFGSAYNNSNPMFQYSQERGGYVGGNTTYLKMLQATNDPRLPVYYALKDTSTVKGVKKLVYVGSAPGELKSKVSPIGSNYASSASPVYLMSYTEVKFIEAEVDFQTGKIPEAVLAYNEGLKASLEREKVYDAAWFAANSITAATISLEKIMNQKYLSSFLQLETFADWRRTGYPTLGLAAGAFTSEIPRRFPYPSDERLYNGANMPTGIKITDHVWWDK